jgi:hypothetical protein
MIRTGPQKEGQALTVRPSPRRVVSLPSLRQPNSEESDSSRFFRGGPRWLTVFGSAIATVVFLPLIGGGTGWIAAAVAGMPLVPAIPIGICSGALAAIVIVFLLRPLHPVLRILMAALGVAAAGLGAVVWNVLFQQSFNVTLTHGETSAQTATALANAPLAPDRLVVLALIAAFVLIAAMGFWFANRTNLEDQRTRRVEIEAQRKDQA